MASTQFKPSPAQSTSPVASESVFSTLPLIECCPRSSDHQAIYNSHQRGKQCTLHRHISTLVLIPLVCSILFVSGCDRSRPAGEFQSYDELIKKADRNPQLDEPQPETTAESGVASSTANPNPSPDSGDSSNNPVPPLNLTVEIPASALAPLNVVDGSSTSAIMKVADSGKPPAAVSALTAVAGTAGESPETPPTPNQIQLLIPNKEFRTEGGDNIWRVSYDDLDLLKVLNMEPVPADAMRYFPGWLTQLDGKQIRIRGFMFPTFESSGIEQFVLARDNQICCFGRNPKVYDLIAVTLKPGSTTDYIPNRPFDVVGTLRIDLLAEEGSLLGLYWLDEAQVIDR